MTTTDYLQREIRRTELSVRRAERKPNTPPEELRGLHEKLEHLQEALKAVEEHWQRVHEQRGWTAGEPLTLEQLRGMDGRPAYWPDDESWGIISVDDAGRCAGIPFFRGRKNGVNFEYDIVSRGMEVYAYPPAHIDLEKWTAEWVDNDQGEGMMCKCFKCGYPVSYFWGKTAFCPGCGRAMTPEAWAELERRVFK